MFLQKPKKDKVIKSFFVIKIFKNVQEEEERNQHLVQYKN